MPVVVAFLSQKGGVGKSTLARALATLAAQSGVKVFVADLDAQQKTIVHWQERRTSRAITPTITVENLSDIDDALSAAEGYQLLVVDASGRASAATLEIAKYAHVVVQPTGAGLDDLYPGVLLFHELVGEGIPRERLVFALCRTSSKQEENAARDYLGKTQYTVLPGSIPEQVIYRYAQNVGRAVTETDDVALNARADEMLTGLFGKLKLEIERLKLSKPGKVRLTGSNT